MKIEHIYVVVKKKENISFCTIDLLKASSLLGIHRNTLRNRLRKSNKYYEDGEVIITIALLYRSNKHGNKANFYLND